MAKPRVVIVAKRTALERFKDEGEDPRVARLLRMGDPSVRRWKKAHDNHVHTLELVEETLRRLGATTWLVHGAGGRFDSKGLALVVSVGGDGTLLAASHNVSGTPILGVNSSPDHSIGFFCAARRRNLKDLLSKALEGTLKSISLSRMQVRVNKRTVSSRVLNEALFCHTIPAATSRYIVRYGRQREEHRSSGLRVGTAAGSTAAIRSAGGKVLPLTSCQLQVVAREIYGASGDRPKLHRFVVSEGRQVVVQNKMQEACLFLDGPFKRVGVALGETMTFSASKQPLTVLGLTASRRRVT